MEVATKEPFNIAGLQSPFFFFFFYSSRQNEAGKGLNGMELQKYKGKYKTKLLALKFKKKLVLFWDCVFCILWVFFFPPLHHLLSEFCVHLFCYLFIYLASVHLSAVWYCFT